MTWECFDVSIENKVAHVRLSRPERINAMTLAFWRELPQIVRSLDSGGGVRAAVVSSSGKHFSAGMDLSVFQDAAALDTSTVAARRSGTHDNSSRAAALIHAPQVTASGW